MLSNVERRRLTCAYVLATVALVVSLGSGVYAAATINSRDVVDNSLKSVDLKNGEGVKGVDVRDNTLTGADIAEGTLAARDGCPGGMYRLGGVVCIDPVSRGRFNWEQAVSFCASVALRLPSPGELYLAYHNDVVAGLGEAQFVWTDVPADPDTSDISIGADAAWVMSATYGLFRHTPTTDTHHVFCATPLSDRY